MKIAFDLRRIRNPGIGRYMKCLTEAVLSQAPDHEYLLVLPPDATGMASDFGGYPGPLESTRAHRLRIARFCGSG